MNKPQKIKCGIESCRHNKPDHYCALSSISVCPYDGCGCDDVHNCQESMCGSFEKKDMGLF